MCVGHCAGPSAGDVVALTKTVAEVLFIILVLGCCESLFVYLFCVHIVYPHCKYLFVFGSGRNHFSGC